jgi:SAM-dependent methyltransferase
MIREGEPTLGDAFGQSLLDHLEHGADGHGLFVERDDGLLELADPGAYFDVESDWTRAEAPVLDRAGSRVLDIGAGAGRHSIPLQESGRRVLALDTSPGAIEVCRRRGVRETFTGTVFDLVVEDAGPFDTFLLCGNNYGLLESREQAPVFLGALAELATADAEVIGTCFDPFATTDPIHLAYHQRNRDRGRLPGQVRLRVRWASLASPWFDYLYVPVDDLAAIAEAGGWRLTETVPGPRLYLAVLGRP